MSVIVLANGLQLICVSYCVSKWMSANMGQFFVLANGLQLICVSYCVSKLVSANICQLLFKQMGVSYNVPVIVLVNGCQIICVRQS